MRAHIADRAVFHKYYLVRIHDRRNSLRNDELGGIGYLLFERLSDQCVRLGIDRAR